MTHVRDRRARRTPDMSPKLGIVSVASFASLFSLVRIAIDTHDARSWEPAFWVFPLVYLLLVPLCVWQVSIAVGAFGLRPH